MKKDFKLIKVLFVIAIIAVVIGFIVGKIQKSKRNYEIEEISEYKYFVFKENDKYGVINVEGNTIIDAEYNDVKIINPSKPVFVCYENQNIKILNEKNEEIFKDYERVEPLRLKNVSGDLIYEKSVLKYSENGKYGIVDIKGKRITKAIYDQIDTLESKEGELLVKKNNKYGVINIKGTTLVNIKYDEITADKYYEEKNGYKNSGYIVKKTTKEGYRYGYVNVDGKEVIKTKYNDLSRVNEIDSKDIYILCAENGKYGLMKNGKKIIKNNYQSLEYNYSNNTIVALKGKKYGTFSIEGKEIVPFDYKQIDVTGEYIYATSNDDKTEVFDSKGNATNMMETTAVINIVGTDYKIRIEDQDGKTVYSIYRNEERLTKSDFAYIQHLFENYFVASNDDGKLAIVDEKGNNKTPFEFNTIQRIENTNMIQASDTTTKVIEIYSSSIKKITELEDAVIENNKDYIKLYNDYEVKYISKDEKEVENTEIYTNNTIFAKKFRNKWGFVNSNGDKIVDFIYDSVTEQNEYGFAGIKQNGKWGIVDKEGKIIVEPKYEISDKNPVFIGELYQVIYGNGEKYFTKQ